MELLTRASYEDRVSERERINLTTAYQAACEAVVLLENRGVLPLQTRKIALYGPGAVHTTKGGTGSGEVNERHSVNILEGLEDRGFQVTTRGWLRDYDECCLAAAAQRLKEARKTVARLKLRSIMDLMFAAPPLPDGRRINTFDIQGSETDTCVYVIARQAGEGTDRKLVKGDYYLTDGERADIAACAAAYENFVVVVNSGAQIDLSFMDEIDGIGALLYICQLGTEGGNALADILTGVVTPSGKLTDTWVRRYEDIPFAMEYSYLNGDLKNEYYKEGIFVGYRYFDSFARAPRYPFGYGMSYTDFSWEMTDVAREGNMVTVTARVTNTGAAPGREVLQLYASAPGEDREYQSLAAFEKTQLLQPGRSQQLQLSFEMASLAAYRDGCFTLEPGVYLLRLGNSSRNTRICAGVELTRHLTVSRHRAICPLEEPMEELKAVFDREALPDGCPRLVWDGEDQDMTIHSYAPPPLCAEKEVRDFVDGLKAEEMAEILVGTGMFGGNHRFQLPGSVGNTTSVFWDRGLANIALCDGPAGLRVQKRSTVSKKGAVRMLDAPIALFDLVPEAVQKLMRGDPEKEPVIYQFATAFPVATAIAQTWNKALAHEIGLAISREMVEYGCTFWLAPAVNIHRNPLCGRNFEYFSEDPFLSGIMAAAITRGIQSAEGCYVTVKHFACNNQEDHRNTVSSNVGERALREIYLRPFRIAVEEGGAKGVMTSYNKLNGVYTANSYDLCTYVLRNEWGFDGVVMTDWFSTNRGLADNALAIAAGNDLIMPGGAGYKKSILKGRRTGLLTDEQMRRCCGNVVKAIMNSRTQKEYIE